MSRHAWRSQSRVVAALGWGLLSSSVFAQQAPVPPPIQAPLPSRQQAGGDAVPPAAPSAGTASVESAGAIAQGDCQLNQSDLAATLTAVRFESPEGGALPAAITTLLAPIRPTGRPAPLTAEVCRLRNEAVAALRGAGYVASVQVPPQEIADGTLRLVVVTAKLVEVRVQGDLDGMRGAIAERVAQIRAMDPLNGREVERILLLANQPGVSIRLRLSPANTRPGEVIGDLIVERQRARLLANIQNYGSPQLGREIASARAEVFGLLNATDSAYLAFSNSLQWHEVHVLQAGYDIGLGGGLRTAVRGSFARSNPSIPNLDLRSQSEIVGWELAMPLARGLHHGTAGGDYDLGVRGGLELLNQKTVVAQGGTKAPFAKDRLRVLFARFDGSNRLLDANGGLRWLISGSLELRKGLDILDATQRGAPSGRFLPSRTDGDPEAFVARGEVNQTFVLLPGVEFDLSTFGQWANHALLNLEEFSLGNLTYGRGYDPGANGGDRALAVRIEPRLRVPGMPLPTQLIGFFEEVGLWNLDRGTSETDRRLRSFGGGVRVTLPGRAVVDVLYAKPLDRALTTDTKRPGGRVLFSLTTKLLPWGAGS